MQPVQVHHRSLDTRPVDPGRDILRHPARVFVSQPMPGLRNDDSLQAIPCDRAPELSDPLRVIQTGLAAQGQHPLRDAHIPEFLRVFPRRASEELDRGFKPAGSLPLLHVPPEVVERDRVQSAVGHVAEVPREELLFAAPDQECGGLGDGEEAQVPAVGQGLVLAGQLEELEAEAGERVFGHDQTLDDIGMVAGEQHGDAASDVVGEDVQLRDAEECEHGVERVAGVLAGEWG